MTDSLFHGCRILTGGAIRPGLAVLVQAGRITAIQPDSAPAAAPRVALPPDCLLAPGFIDIQVNGGGGVLFNDAPTAEAALHIAAAHRRLGTTSILPTLITSAPADMRLAAAAMPQAASAGQGVLGIHFEGPFLSPDKPGVHRRDHIRAPDEADLALLESLAGAGIPTLLTLAPECVPPDMLRRLAGAGVILSAGHSQAGFEQAGPPVTGVTHLFNAMKPLAARDPGLAAAAMLNGLFVGVIMDFIHVHPAMLRLLLAAASPDRIMLVSDSMSVAGTDATSFMLQGRTILRRDGRLTTPDGTLAGADLSLAQAVRNATTKLGLAPETAIAMASATPAAFLGLGHEVGSIAPGLRADMVLLSPALEVLGTILAGAWQAA